MTAIAIAIQNLSHRYGSVVAVDHLSLEIPEGAVYGLIGPNGAGKTTTIRSICTLLVPTSGDVLVQGLSIRRDARSIRPALGYMPDNFGLYDELRVWEYLDFFARCYAIAPAVRATTIPEVLELVDLSGKHDAYVAGLSRGMRQRLAIARTLLHDPSILILDEPAAGLDPRARIELRELLRELRRLGKTILLSSHILSDLAEICTHVAIVDRGRLVVDGPLSEVLSRVQGGRTLHIEVLGPWDAARQLLESLPRVRDVRSEEQESGRTRLVCQLSGDDGDQIAVLARLVSDGIPVATFREETANLEEVFMRLTAPFSA